MQPPIFDRLISSTMNPSTVENGAKSADHADIVEVHENLHDCSKISSNKEKQISVDPISLSSVREESSDAVLPPPISVPKLSFMGSNITSRLPPISPKLLSFSLPNSATSSPRFSTSSKKKWNSSSPVLSQQLRRSKSCGERRACAPPLSDEFDDLWSNGTVDDKSREGLTITRADQSFKGGNKDEMKRNKEEDGFKCGALCLFLPGFGRGKPVRARKEEEEVVNDVMIMSRTVSLEKFECASWASSAVANSSFEEDGDSMNLYFDLPLELIRTSVNDANSPVAAAFVFDKNTNRGVLKNNGMGKARKSQESSRQVRFSTSTPISYPPSPTSNCITPRLRKAREDFNAYLEAQS